MDKKIKAAGLTFSMEPTSKVEITMSMGTEMHDKILEALVDKIKKAADIAMEKHQTRFSARNMFISFLHSEEFKQLGFRPTTPNDWFMLGIILTEMQDEVKKYMIAKGVAWEKNEKSEQKEQSRVCSNCNKTHGAKEVKSEKQVDHKMLAREKLKAFSSLLELLESVEELLDEE